jgi:hypothetical protein
VKPVNPSPAYCPLWRKPCKRMCHQCELWQPLEIVRAGRASTEWKCAILWHNEVAVMSSHQLEGLGKATESLRNRFEGFRASVLQLVAAMGGIHRMLGRQPHNGGELTEVKDDPPERE